MATYYDSAYRDALALLDHSDTNPLLATLKRGIEKEGLRCSNQGVISQQPHPTGLGSALMHPSITTDYSEALLEFITPAYESGHEAIAHLDVAHRFALSQMDSELIWPSSMPCILQGEMSVPIADYGRSNLGQLKHIYRHGLWHRYGRVMQCIAGIHYNFSLPDGLWDALIQADPERASQQSRQDYISARYFGLLRNFRRYSWLLVYLFGASPAVCSSFLEDREHHLERLHDHTLYLPYATSLRMSDLGYQSNAQSSLQVCYNQLSTYIKTLGQAVQVPVDAYEAIGIKTPDGHYKQLNTNLLQIENEYYSDIRPKRIAQQGEKPLEALQKYGVEYIEVRCTDLNPFLPLGIDVPQTAFTDLFLCYCLLHSSPDIDMDEQNRIHANLQATVMEGRQPGLALNHNGSPRELTEWGTTLLDNMEALATLMDQANGHTFHSDALAQQRLKLADSDLTPSAQVLRSLTEQQLEFSDFTLQQAQQHRKTLSEPLGSAVRAQWAADVATSQAQQTALENSDTLGFDAYLQRYMQR